MRKLAIVLCLFFYAFTVNAQKTQLLPDPAPAAAATGAILDVHVIASHVQPCWFNPCGNILYLNVVIGGKKYELEGSAMGSRKMFGRDVSAALLPPGDYQARLTKDLHSASGMVYQEYELLLADNSTWKCVLSGMSE